MSKLLQDSDDYGLAVAMLLALAILVCNVPREKCTIEAIDIDSTADIHCKIN